MSGTFLQFNPGAANQQNDTAYLADGQRTGGITTAALLPSPLGNKMFYQWSTFITAFAAMMQGKGYPLSDADLPSLIAALGNLKTANEFLAAIVTVPYASSVTFDAATSKEFDLTLTGDVTSSFLVHQHSGDFLLFAISQDGVGGRSFAWPGSISSPGPICPIAGSTSVQLFLVKPSGAIVPVTSMQWVTSSGIALANGPAVVSISSSGTVSSAYPEITEKVNCSGGNITRNLYAATPSRTGYKVNIKKFDTSQNSIDAVAAAGQFIDAYAGGTPLTDWLISQQGESYSFQCDGSGWILI